MLMPTSLRSVYNLCFDNASQLVAVPSVSLSKLGRMQVLLVCIAKMSHVLVIIHASRANSQITALIS